MRLRAEGIQAVFHYVPLHSSPQGALVSRTASAMTNTVAVSERLVRLPMWLGVETDLDRVIEVTLKAIA